jgi:hypothetical protein
MKNKHNKKRNTAFIYESLVKEATVAMLRSETEKKRKVVSLIKRHFHSDSLLNRELECYKSLYEKQDLEEALCEKIIKEAKIARRLIDPDGLFKQQTELIKDINKDLGPSVYNNYVPNYRTLASISQLFSTKLSPKNAVILEKQLVTDMATASSQGEAATAVDGLVVQSFVQKFNSKYSETLLEEQKTLLGYYISSFSDNELELKMFLNEEIKRLKDKLIEAKRVDDIKSDPAMVAKTETIIEKLNSFSCSAVNDQVLILVMKTQKLVKEIYNDGNNG